MKNILLIVLMAISIYGISQDLPGGLTQSQSRQWLKDNWYTGKHKELSYDSARIYMYGFIDNYGDSIECVYSGYKRKLNYGTNNVTFPSPINCEHTVPQSFFSSTLPQLSDLFHMFPSYDQWNNDRGNNPFSEITDAQTEKWIYKTSSQTSIPSTNKDLYSEYKTSTFEPREQHKGNLARAVFYFFTMYSLSSNNISDVADVNTLCTWAKNDPPDSREIERNNRIQQFQKNRNPYIDHNDWLTQAWGCPNIPAGIADKKVFEPVQIFPVPAENICHVAVDKKYLHGALKIFNLLGIKIYDEVITSSGNLQIDISGWERGYYLVVMNDEKNEMAGESVLIKQ